MRYAPEQTRANLDRETLAHARLSHIEARYPVSRLNRLGGQIDFLLHDLALRAIRRAEKTREAVTESATSSGTLSISQPATAHSRAGSVKSRTANEPDSRFRLDGRCGERRDSARAKGLP